MEAARHRIFLLSPAHTGGVRGRLVLNERAQFPLARQLRREGAPLGDVFSFVSGLYFRGKVAYARAFAAAPPGAPGALIITPDRGLVALETRVTLDDLLAMAGVPVDLREPRYRVPLERDARAFAEAAGSDASVVLLGSVATDKYLRPLLDIFGPRLMYPAAFAGLGDMSRGSLMLRAARAGVELDYVTPY